MVDMRWKRGASAIALAGLVASSTTAWGAPKCARPDEMTAIQVAAVQQELMVAALTCNEIEHFNAFQTGFAPELRTWDARLMKMFQRLFGYRQGQGQYHAFKTRLANNSSMRSIHNNPDYCHEAAQVFAAALVSQKPTLEAFVSGIPVIDQGPVNSCDIRVANGLSGAKAAPNVVPVPNPERAASVIAPPPGPAPIPGGAQPGSASATTASATTTVSN